MARELASQAKQSKRFKKGPPLSLIRRGRRAPGAQPAQGTSNEALFSKRLNPKHERRAPSAPSSDRPEYRHQQSCLSRNLLTP